MKLHFNILQQQLKQTESENKYICSLSPSNKLLYDIKKAFDQFKSKKEIQEQEQAKRNKQDQAFADVIKTREETKAQQPKVLTFAEKLEAYKLKKQREKEAEHNAHDNVKKYQ